MDLVDAVGVSGLTLCLEGVRRNSLKVLRRLEAGVIVGIDGGGSELGEAVWESGVGIAPGGLVWENGVGIVKGCLAFFSSFSKCSSNRLDGY